MFEHSPVDEEICSEVMEERNTTEECEAPAPPRVAWGNNTTEKHSKWRSVCAGVRRVWKAGKRLFHTNETEVCAFVPPQEHPHTPAEPQERPHTPAEPQERPHTPAEPQERPHTPAEPQERPQTPAEPQERPHTRAEPQIRRPTHRSFESLYIAVKKLKSRGDRSDYMGFRHSDSKRVIVSFFKKSRPEKLVDVPGYSTPLSRGAAAMLLLLKPPTSTHIIQLYDMFVMEDQDILVLEYPQNAMTLYEYVQRNRANLSECVVKHILRQLVVALQHCMDHGVYHDTHMKNVLIYANTLQVKLMDFSGALLLQEGRADEPILNAAVRKYAEWATTDDIRKLLDALVPGISHCFWQTSYLSKECQDLLEKLHDRGTRITLDGILQHDWFKNPSKRR